MTTTRRKFLSFLGFGAAAASAGMLTPKSTGDGKALISIPHPRLQRGDGFGLAPLKTEGGTYAHDPHPFRIVGIAKGEPLAEIWVVPDAGPDDEEQSR